MITYSIEARDNYIDSVETLQKKLASVKLEENGITHEEMYWLINVALSDLKKQVKKEWKK